jgi:FdhD protein
MYRRDSLSNGAHRVIFHSPTATTQLSRIENGVGRLEEDALAIEEPLELRLDFKPPGAPRVQKSLSVTMRTPGHDLDLALGFLLTEGVLSTAIKPEQQVVSVEHCGPAQRHLGHSNVVKVVLHDTVEVKLATLERNFFTTSSCGICGKASIDALRLKDGVELAKWQDIDFTLPTRLVTRLPDFLRDAQAIFATTGGLHASGLFDAGGQLQVLREDVGRHNALDKVIGWAFQAGRLPLKRSILMLSGRVSFELVQKAAMAGIPVIVAVGAPSTLALQLAIEANLTLIGFTRGERFNVYHGGARLT